MSNDGTIIGNNETTAVRPFGIRDKIGYLWVTSEPVLFFGLVNSFNDLLH